LQASWKFGKQKLILDLQNLSWNQMPSFLKCKFKISFLACICDIITVFGHFVAK
jgi:hypothetical protein